MRNLVDMHIPDTDERFLTKFSAEEYARLVEMSGADTAIIYTSNCVGNTFFPVENAHSGMNGRDFVAERIEEFKKRGIRVIVYYNIWNRVSALKHPEWRLRNMRENSDGMNGRFLRCCINSEGFRDYVSSQLRVLAENYDFDGVWIDMIDWFDAICGCESCRRKFKSETGLELPLNVDFSDDCFVKFREARERWLCEFLDLVKSSIKSIKPDATVTFQNASWKRGWETGITQESMSKSEFLAGDFYSSPVSYGVTCKFLNNATANRPIEFMTSFCAELSEHTTSKTEHELLTTVRGALAHNAAFTFIDAIDPVGTMNESRYRLMAGIKKKTDPERANIAPDARLISDVTYYVNHDSMMEDLGCVSIADFRKRSAVSDKMIKFASAMIERHVSYDFNLKKNIDSITSPVIFIAGMRMISESEVESLTRFVEAGGRLIVTDLAGTMKRSGGYTDDFALADLLGVHLLGKTDKDIVYLSATECGKKYFDGYDDGYPVAVNRHGVLVSADRDVEILAKLSLPLSSSDNTEVFSSAISNPPYDDTDYPAITLRRVGKGEAIYVAAPIEEGMQDMQHRLLASLICDGIDRNVRASAPSWLEVITYLDEEKDRYIVNCFNTMEHYYEAEARDVKISVKVHKNITKVYNITDKKPISFEMTGDAVNFTVDRVDGLAMIVME